MSFSSKIKNEILSQKFKDDVFTSFLSAIIKTSGEIVLRNGEFGVEIKTENELEYNLINRCIKAKYGME